MVDAYIVPPRLAQASGDDGVGNCFLVASLNQLGQTAEGRAHLASLVRPLQGGFYEVTLLDPEAGEPRRVVVARAAGGGGTGDPTLAIVEKAAHVLADTAPDDPRATEREIMRRSNYADGGNADDAMRMLGLRSQVLSFDDAIANAKARPHDLHVLDSNRARYPVHVMGFFNIAEGHSYELVGLRVEPATGIEQVLLRNPAGHSHPKPVPVDLARQAFARGVTGQIPGPPTHGP